MQQRRPYPGDATRFRRPRRQGADRLVAYRPAPGEQAHQLTSQLQASPISAISVETETYRPLDASRLQYACDFTAFGASYATFDTDFHDVFWSDDPSFSRAFAIRARSSPGKN